MRTGAEIDTCVDLGVILSACASETDKWAFLPSNSQSL